MLLPRRFFDFLPLVIAFVLIFSLCNCSAGNTGKTGYTEKAVHTGGASSQELLVVPLRLVNLGDSREAPILALFRKVAAKFSKEAGIQLRLDSLETLPYPANTAGHADERLANIRHFVERSSTHKSQAFATVVFLPSFESLQVNQAKLHGLAEDVGAHPQASSLALVVRSGQEDRDALVFAHELGHLLGAQHAYGGLMSAAFERRSTQFSPRAIYAMHAHLLRSAAYRPEPEVLQERALFFRAE